MSLDATKQTLEPMGTVHEKYSTPVYMSMEAMECLCRDHPHRAPTRQIFSADTQGQHYPMLGRDVAPSASDSTVTSRADGLGQVWSYLWDEASSCLK